MHNKVLAHPLGLYKGKYYCETDYCVEEIKLSWSVEGEKKSSFICVERLWNDSLAYLTGKRL